MTTRRTGLFVRSSERTKSGLKRLRKAAFDTLERRNYMAANVVISEFLASNDHGLVDSFGAREDWIEIHNAGDASANLNDYFLTDSATNLQQWRLPSKTIAAGGYQIVFASGLDTVTSGGEMHTNFKLSASGEYLGLVRASDGGVQFEYAPTFPAQSTDVSYGLADANNPTGPRAYSITPTPGLQNKPSTNGVLFSTTGKVFNGSLSITLTSSTPGAVIYYTTDRSLPTTSSSTFSAPITVNATTMIRAFASAAPYAVSPVVSQTYILADAATASFSSNLPIVVLDSFGQTFNDQTAVSATATFVNTASNGLAQANDIPDFSGRIGLRYRGSTSYTNPDYLKKQFALETEDETNADKDVSLLGLPADSDWTLYAPYTERSLMNNQLAMLWANETGEYASRTRFVEVYLNTTAGAAVTQSSYLGVYILMEKPKAGVNRINITKNNPADTTGDAFSGALSGGYIFKKDRVETTEVSFSTSGLPTVNGAANPQKFVMVSPDETEITATGPQVTALKTYMNTFESTLYGANFADPVNGYAKYIDVDSFVNYFLVDEMTRNVDGFWLSTFFSKDINGKVKVGPAWDFNLALGAANYNQSSNAQGFDTDLLDIKLDPYFKQLLNDPNFKQKVADRWQQLRAGVFSNASLNADINADVALLSNNSTNYPIGPNGAVPTQAPTNALVRNFVRWNELGKYITTDGFYDPMGRWIEDVNLMRNWLMARVDWMDSNYIAAPTISPGGSFLGSTSVSMAPRAQATAADTVLIDAGAATSVFIPGVTSGTSTNWQSNSFTSTTGWLTGTTGIGYSTISGDTAVLAAIKLNVQAMKNVSPSLYARLTFTLTQAQIDDLQHLVLRMKYDDGFTAWVNGVRVADVNSPENVNPTSTTLAATDRDDSARLTYTEYDISSVRNFLVVGQNTLAIQGMNYIKNSNDFLLIPQLVTRKYQAAATGAIYYTTDGTDPRASGGGVSPTALSYSGTLSLSNSKHIRARTLVNGAWSGLADQVYDFAPDTLRVTELMYNPTDNQNYEYIELKNTGNTPLDLTGYAFTTGIAGTFPSTTLAPGAYGVFVKDLPSFQARYGTGINVLGTYTGSLDNGGEQIILSKTINGVVSEVQNFTYDDTGTGWYPQTDGSGYSLVIRDPTGIKANWSDPAGWRASYQINGLPGVADDDNIAPTITSAAFAPTAGTLQVQFSEPIKIGLMGGWTITNVLAGTTITPGSITAAGSVGTLALPALASGLYRLNLTSAGASDLSNNPLAAAFAWTMLYVQDGQTFVLPVNSPTYAVDQLAIGTASKLDLKNNGLVVHKGNVGTPSPTGYIGLTGLIASARDDGAWDGAGITSSVITATTSIGIGSGADTLHLTGTQTAAWKGIVVNATDALLRYTMAGDVTLDGIVNFDDLIVIAQNYNTTSQSYANGNINLSIEGNVNFDDLISIAQNYNQSLPAMIVSTKPKAAPRVPVASKIFA